MKKSGRYDVSDLVEAQFERGSGGRVLKNRLGIRSRRKKDYVGAIQVGLDRNYDWMGRIFAEIIDRSLDAS